jgi:molybdopterin adenylyltransferase
MRFALLVLSDKAASGVRDDACLPVMEEGLPPGSQVVAREIVPDDRSLIEARLRTLCDSGGVDCVLTSGGTGLGARDVTPQATLAVMDYEVPGIADAMRAASLAKVPAAMLSRAVAAVRRSTLIVNLPGSPRGVRETLAVVSAVLPHAIGLLAGSVGEHAAER